MGLDEEAERVVAEARRQIAEHEKQIFDAWHQDAVAALADGRAYYQPILPAGHGRSGQTPRDADCETALAAITAAGWKLHTWAVLSGPMVADHLSTARPLFIRPA